MIRRKSLCRPKAGLGPALLALACLLLAACGASRSATRADAGPTATATTLAPTATATTATATTAAGSCPTRAPGGLAPTATPPAPTPIPAGSWAGYTNNTVEYPSTWRTFDTSPTANVFQVRNYDSAAFPAYAPPPPYNGVEISGFPNPDMKSPLDLYLYQRANDELKIPPCSQTTQTTTVGGRAALQIVQWPVATGNAPPILYPQVQYFVADGATMLILSEYYSPRGQPSATFARMIASLVVTGLDARQRRGRRGSRGWASWGGTEAAG